MQQSSWPGRNRIWQFATAARLSKDIGHDLAIEVVSCEVYRNSNYIISFILSKILVNDILENTLNNRLDKARVLSSARFFKW